MIKYPKIHTIYKRETRTGKLIEEVFSLPVFDYLKDNMWYWTEKVDGTNIRIEWNGNTIEIGGRTDKAQISIALFKRLNILFPREKFSGMPPMILFGEGYGAGIGKSGGKYKPKGVDFVLFDINIDNWWLERKNIQSIAMVLNVEVVPMIGIGSLTEAAMYAKEGFNSQWGNFVAEGMVVKPMEMMLFRDGTPIMAKIKYKDFRGNAK